MQIGCIVNFMTNTIQSPDFPIMLELEERHSQRKMFTAIPIVSSLEL